MFVFLRLGCWKQEDQKFQNSLDYKGHYIKKKFFFLHVVSLEVIQGCLILLVIQIHILLIKREAVAWAKATCEILFGGKIRLSARFYLYIFLCTLVFDYMSVCEDVGSPGTGATGSCELPCAC